MYQIDIKGLTLLEMHRIEIKGLTDLSDESNRYRRSCLSLVSSRGKNLESNPSQTAIDDRQFPLKFLGFRYFSGFRYFFRLRYFFGLFDIFIDM